MNDTTREPDQKVVDIEAQRAWINDLHTTLGSWAEVAKQTNIPLSTVQAFAAGKYNGENEKVALRVMRHREMLAAHAAVEVDMPSPPVFFESETAQRLTNMLTYAQKFGEIVVAATGPGNSKTSAARNFRSSYPGVFIVTCKPSTAGVNNMQVETLKAMGEADAKGTPQRLTHRIIERVEKIGNPLIIFDDSQHLAEKALEEIRGWHDEAGVGIALFGNSGILQRLEGGNRAIAFAQLFSRLGLVFEQNLPLEQDIDALAAAWGITDAAIIATLRKICMKPGALRNGTKSLKLAHMLANSQGKPLDAKHLSAAWAQLSMRVQAA